MKTTFFIEGADNVGKTTLLNICKSEKFMNRLSQTIHSEYPERDIIFTKYPSSNITDYLNYNNKKIKESLSNITNYSNRIDKYNLLLYYYDEFKNYKNDMIKKLLTDMEESFSPDYVNNTVNISDRGLLSTYMYQYKNSVDLNVLNFLNLNNKIHFDIIDAEAMNFFNFLDKYVDPIFHIKEDINTNLNIIILNNNNKDIPLTIDETETIEYKKDYDNDKYLQNRNNIVLNHIISLSKKDKFKSILYNVYGITIYYINIYDENLIRKTPEELSEELFNIMESKLTSKEENK